MADTDDIVTDGGPTASPQDAQLDALSRSEDATAYIEQRQDDLRAEQGLEPETPADERQNRIDQALEKAREDSRKARETKGHLDQEWQQAEQAQLQAEQQLQQQQAATQAYFEARGLCKAKGEQLR